MYIATTHRVARQFGLPLGGSMIYRCRRAVGIFLLGSALLLTPNAVYAQGETSELTPSPALAPEIAPSEDATLAIDTVSVDTASLDAEEIFHTIQVGDSLSKIAQRYNVTMASLAAYNDITDPNHILIGQQLRIPPVGATITTPAITVPTPSLPAATGTSTLPGTDGYHVVRQGEGLGAIAQRYNLTIQELMDLNDIENPNLVQMGSMLRLTPEVEPASKVFHPRSQMVAYTVKAGETLEEIAQQYRSTVAQIVADNQLTDLSLRAGQELKVFAPASALEAFGVDAPTDGERKIVITLSNQTLTVYQGDVVLMHTHVSTGKASTPTRTGEYAIYLKYQSQRMTGDGYDLPGVPWVMYYDGDFAVHGAYWHTNFGVPSSHGCTNMRIPESQAIFSWAPIGTRVSIQW